MAQLAQNAALSRNRQKDGTTQTLTPTPNASTPKAAASQRHQSAKPETDADADTRGTMKNGRSAGPPTRTEGGGLSYTTGAFTRKPSSFRISPVVLRRPTPALQCGIWTPDTGLTHTHASVVTSYSVNKHPLLQQLTGRHIMNPGNASLPASRVRKR